jgi:hypothetical protein
MLTFILIFLAVVAAYYFLGTPLLGTIHQFTEQFTRSFPLWAFFLPMPIPAGRATDTRGRRRRRASPAAREGTPRFR